MSKRLTDLDADYAKHGITLVDAITEDQKTLNSIIHGKDDNLQTQDLIQWVGLRAFLDGPTTFDGVMVLLGAGADADH